MNARITNRNRAKKGNLPTPGVGSSRPSTTGGDRILPSKGKGSENEHPKSHLPTRPSPGALVIKGEAVERTPQVRAGPKEKRVLESEKKSKRPRKEVAEGPSNPKKHKKGSKSLRSSKSSKQSKSTTAERMAVVDKNEEENFQLTGDLNKWWIEAEEELQYLSSKTGEMSGEKKGPDWAIFDQSTVLGTRAGQDSWEVYRSSLF
ncbi:UNVERIFIED_CONTAM: hypothetical protein Sangu_0384900 [Sesamum angustifolium]|uniref:Uncharacterized protein n=1 Tax=Sesamum angustifolium TaxID=2727405 RepID=A0AAW2QSM1_9LAMI